MRRAIPIAIGALLLVAADGSRKPLPELTPEVKGPLVAYLKAHWQSPEDYIVGEFADHDIVVVGEYHRIRHDTQLIQNLIPRLYAAGIHNLGIEFGCVEYQDTADYLVNAPTYDESLARWLIFKQGSYWGFVEYEDLYRRAWEVNHSLPPDAPRFRIVHLDYCPRWELAKEDMTREERLKVFYKGEFDVHQAQMILTEFAHSGQKALIYCGNHHAFTRFRQHSYFEQTKAFGESIRRMGNIVNDSLPGRVFCVMLHRPWDQKANMEEHNYPVGGVIDAVMREFPNPRVGFDVVGSPFGALTDTAAYYSVGYDHFTLADYCDGYIFQMPFSQYEGCRVDTLFITPANFEEALAAIPNMKARAYFTKPADLIESMQRDADFKRRFYNLQ